MMNIGPLKKFLTDHYVYMNICYHMDYAPTMSIFGLPNPLLFQNHTPNAYIPLEEDDDEEEDFQTVSLDDEHWTTGEIPDRPLCIHEHSLPHRLCPYPCPYLDY